MFKKYLSSLDEAHKLFLEYILKGYKFQKMEQNPIHSADLNHGVPQAFNDILNDLLEDELLEAAFDGELDMANDTQSQPTIQVSPRNIIQKLPHNTMQEESNSFNQDLPQIRQSMNQITQSVDLIIP